VAEPSGRWNCWDLSGRFDGIVRGEKRASAGSESMISSGPNNGRDLLGVVARALGAKPSEAEAEIAANVDLVSALVDAARRDNEHALPDAVVLPVGACAYEFRRFDSLGWRPIPPGRRRCCPCRTTRGSRSPQRRPGSGSRGWLSREWPTISDRTRTETMPDSIGLNFSGAQWNVKGGNGARQTNDNR